MPLHACMHAHNNVLCVCLCAWQTWAAICCLLIRSHHLISIWIDSCNADSFHPCHSWRQENNSRHREQHCSTLMASVYVCHSLTAESVTSHPVFLTHLQQNCNLVHWTFKLLDVTSERIGGEKHHVLLIVTSLTSVIPAFAPLPPFYSTCYFLPIIIFSIFSWTRASSLLNTRLYRNVCTILP